MALFIWGMAALLMAQATGGVTGQVIGRQGKPLAGYTVVILDLNTHYPTKTKTNKKGIYIFLGLPFHQYKLTLEDPSGKEVRTINGQSLVVGDMTHVDFNLQEQPEQPGGSEQAAPTGQWNYSGGQMTGWKGPSSGRNRKKVVALARQAEKEANAGQLAQAAADYQQALQLGSPDGYLENALGAVYARLNNVEGAVQAFQKAADSDPKHAGLYYFNKGAVLENNGQMAAAAEAFKKCLAADPDNAEAYYWEGQALIAQAKTLPGGKVVAAPGTVEAYKNYLKLAPNGPHAAVVRQILQTLSP
jgi:Carboxypeptidase regulatory-like domain/Tetratricopeptide repeat